MPKKKEKQLARWSGFGLVNVIGEAESPLRGKYFKVRSAVKGFGFGTKEAYPHELTFLPPNRKKGKK